MSGAEHFTEASYDNVTFVRIHEDTLFYTVEYTIRIVVEGRFVGVPPKVMFESVVYEERPSQETVLDWLKMTILQSPTRFESFGIDIEELYFCCGGNINDLYEE